jgi:hypothetical protein
MEPPHFYLYDDYDGKWNWKYFAPDPASMKVKQVAACTSPFATREECERAIEHMRDLGLKGHIRNRQSTS